MQTLALCYGTRPQVIKASVLRATLSRGRRVRAIDTGQHYDYELNALLYEQLSVSAPDEFLNVGSGSHAEQLSAIVTAAASSFERNRPDAVVVIGDTNSTLGCALAAVQLRIPVVHVEAGLRAADGMMAEEINRRAVDAIAQVLCTPSAKASRIVRTERPDALVYETGDVARDVLASHEPHIDRSELLRAIPHARDPFIFATIHRAELTSDRDALRAVSGALEKLTLPVVLPAHPRTRQSLERTGIRFASGRVTVTGPLGYLQTLACIQGASAIVTDSGGVQREAYWLGTPCVTLRGETEWTETVSLGANRLCSARDASRLTQLVDEAIRAPRSWDRTAYGTGQAAAGVAAAIDALLAEKVGGATPSEV